MVKIQTVKQNGNTIIVELDNGETHNFVAESVVDKADLKAKIKARRTALASEESKHSSKLANLKLGENEVL